MRAKIARTNWRPDIDAMTGSGVTAYSTLGVLLSWLGSFPGDSIARSLLEEQAHFPLRGTLFVFPAWLILGGLLPGVATLGAEEPPLSKQLTELGRQALVQELTDFILSELKDRPDLIEKCVPTYPPYGKRILLDNNWFKTLTKPNVELVTEPIDHFAREAILTADGKLREHDIAEWREACGWNDEHIQSLLRSPLSSPRNASPLSSPRRRGPIRRSEAMWQGQR